MPFRTFLLALLAASVSFAQQPPLEEAYSDGKSLYGAYCAVCHGPGGKGDGPAAVALKAESPDLTQLAAANRGRFPRAQVDTLIRNENGPAAHGTAAMPIWGPVFQTEAQLDPESRDKLQIFRCSGVSTDELARLRVKALIDHVESLQTKKR